MKKQIFEINENGFYLNDVIIESEEHYPRFYTETPFPQDDEGRQLPFYRARWNGAEWIEEMTQQEINEIRNQPIEPTHIEIMGQLNSEREIQEIVKGQQISELELQVLELKLQLGGM